MRVRILTVLAVLPLLAACSTANLTGTTVKLPGRLPSECLAASLRAEADVVNFRRVPNEGGATYWFEIADPALVDGGLPAFSVRQREDRSAVLLDSMANFPSRRRDGERLRAAVLERQQEMLSRAVSSCAASGVRFDAAVPCGKGETETLCSKGEVLLVEPSR